MSRRSLKGWRKLRGRVYKRSRGACERCFVGIPEDGFECHHRKLRSRGGEDTVINCVALCDRCHGHIHAHPAQSTEEGWMVPSHANPAQVPVWRFGAWERLTEEGCWQQAKSAAPPQRKDIT